MLNRELDISQDYWLQQSSQQKYKIWSGFAFELLTLKHVKNIKKALGISGINVLSCTWRNPGDKTTPGAQIDLVLDRADRIVSLCEIKYSLSGIRVSGELRKQIACRQEIFKVVTKAETKEKKVVNSFVISSGGFVEDFKADSLIVAGLDGSCFFN